jgi:hypothetical protein
MLNTHHLLDETVLCNLPVRDTLLWLSRRGIYYVQWSPAIFSRMRHRLLIDNPTADITEVDNMIHWLREAFPKADIVFYQEALDWVSREGLLQPEHRHVLAAALAGDVYSIVTMNTQRFSFAVPNRCKIIVETPDELACRSLRDDWERVLEALFLQADDWVGNSSPRFILRELEDSMPRFYEQAGKYFNELPPLEPPISHTT